MVMGFSITSALLLLLPRHSSCLYRSHGVFLVTSTDCGRRKDPQWIPEVLTGFRVSTLGHSPLLNAGGTPDTTPWV